MAITIATKPPLHTPAYNEQYFDCTSTNTGQTNFSYIVDIVVDGVTARKRIAANPNDGHLYVDCMSVIMNFFTFDFFPTIDEISTGDELIKSVRVNFFEEYGSTPTITGQLASYTYYAWAASYNTYSYLEYDYATLGSLYSLLLSDSVDLTVDTLPTRKRNYLDYNKRYNFVMWHQGFAGDTNDRLIIECYDQDGLTQTTKITNNYSAGSPYTQDILIANLTPYGMNLLETNNPGDIISKSDGGADIIPSNTTYFYAYFANSSDVAVSETYHGAYEVYCTKYGAYNLNFLNTLGGFDTFTFALKNITTSEKTQEEFTRFPFTNTGTDYIYNSYSNNRVTYGTKVKDRMSLTTGWISEAQAVLLKSLFTSNYVVMEDPDNKMYQVKVTDNSYETQKKANKKLFNYTINIEFAFISSRQE